MTGRSYAHELRTRLLEPVGLDDTYLPGRGEVRLRGPHAHGYVRVHGHLVDVTAQSAYGWAEAGMVSTTRDLGRFLGALMAGRGGAAALARPDADRPRRALRGQRRRVRSGTGRGPRLLHLGPAADPLPGGPVVYGKSGGLPGYRTLVVATEDGGRVLATSLTTTGNRDGSEDERLLGIAAAAFGLSDLLPRH